MVVFFFNGGVAACKVVAFHQFVYCWFQLMIMFVYSLAASAGGKGQFLNFLGGQFLDD